MFRAALMILVGVFDWREKEDIKYIGILIAKKIIITKLTYESDAIQFRMISIVEKCHISLHFSVVQH